MFTFNYLKEGLLRWLSVKEPPANAGVTGSISGSARSLGGGNGNPLQYSCLKKSHGQNNLVGYHLWGHKELDTIERLSMHALKRKTSVLQFERIKSFFQYANFYPVFENVIRKYHEKILQYSLRTSIMYTIKNKYIFKIIKTLMIAFFPHFGICLRLVVRLFNCVLIVH